MSNVIMRPVYNRPEMLYLSIAAEKKAREYYDMKDLVTLFVVEYGSPNITLELINKYPFPKKCIFRDRQYGLTINILEGMKTAFEGADDHIIYIEDDILVHKTYFQYLSVLLGMFSSDEYTVLSSYNSNDTDGGVDKIHLGHHYAALAPLIDKRFFEDYIKPCIKPEYYANYGTRDRFVRKLAKKYSDNQFYKYKDKPGMHNEQAGLINKLVDAALIEKHKYVIQPFVNRQVHIGYYGKNRAGMLRGKTFKERLQTLADIIKSPDKMYEAAQSKQYNDYKTFSTKLEAWDGTLSIKPTNFSTKFQNMIGDRK